MQVNQIWIGGELPERERSWVDAIKAGALAAGHRHKLWSWADIMAAYGHEPLAPVFSRAMEWLPIGTVYALMVDYYQYRVLADNGGLYLDTDITLSGQWPQLPDEGAEVWGIPEFYDRHAMCCGLFYARHAQPMKIAARLAEEHLLHHLDSTADDFELRLVRMVRGGGNITCGVGPGWLRRVVLPAWEAAGITYDFLPAEQAGHAQWRDSKSALTHIATAHWHVDRWEKEGYWTKQIQRAQLAIQARATAKMSARPTALRPQGRLLLPKPKKRKWPPPAQAEKNASTPLFYLPAGVRRIVIFSNVRRGFNAKMANLREGDLCLHLNYAVHFEQASKVPGTRHMLFVRPRASWRTQWFTTGQMNGYEHVVFLRDEHMIRHKKWFAEFRKEVPHASPTTGFIVANEARELFPQIPLLLAGFDPAVDHGTGRATCHDWLAESKWYNERSFRLLTPGVHISPPVQPARILLLINSCREPDTDKLAAAKVARNSVPREQRRQACRDTWLAHLPPGTDYRFIVGEGSQTMKEDILVAPAADSLQALGKRSAYALRWALEHGGEWEWLVRTDDDDYIDIPAMQQWLHQLDKESIAIYGMKCPAPGLGDMLAGCAQVLSRHTAHAVAKDTAYPAPTHADDIDLCRAVLRAGGEIHQPSALQAAKSPHALPTGILSAYWLTPAHMRTLHTAQHGWVAPLFTGGRLGNNLFELAATYAHARRHGYQCYVPWQQNIHVRTLSSILGSPLPLIPTHAPRIHNYTGFPYKPIPPTAHGGLVRGFFQSARYFADEEQAIRQLYAPLTATSKEHATLGIHIRLGDYKKRPELYNIIDAAWLRRALAETSCQKIILFYSDDKDEAHKILTDALHGQHGYTIEIQHSSPAEDLRRLTAMQELIISASTFAWWGAYLGAQQKVIAPKNWFVGKITDFQDIYLQHWQKL